MNSTQWDPNKNPEAKPGAIGNLSDWRLAQRNTEPSGPLRTESLATILDNTRDAIASLEAIVEGAIERVCGPMVNTGPANGVGTPPPPTLLGVAKENRDRAGYLVERIKALIVDLG